ncbi:hypothetical protein [Nocardia cyriacigeorgica]|uniref:hypothetical protein n=1 Tax=Nocardia cyriacigeorgica TaxID=135487 RepID=UPI0018936413|nr:hypothetical protein [Nocardia cyriacigeorgica]MBF6454549.1 hypothetical protein [Nocardia cyriacigeorgica]MBF6552443.1 hypothetical protein [Nocardia cyriacigeorgica]
MTALSPLAYGYLRDELLVDVELPRCDQRLIAIARQMGFDMAAIFHERADIASLVPGAFLDLVHECRRARARMVFTLPGHIAGLTVPAASLLHVLADRGEAAVFEVPESTWRDPWDAAWL